VTAQLCLFPKGALLACCGQRGHWAGKEKDLRVTQKHNKPDGISLVMQGLNMKSLLRAVAQPLVVASWSDELRCLFGDCFP